MQQKLVNLGTAHDCNKCEQRLEKGQLAVKRSRRAETYHEKCHADRHGQVTWYYCVGCFKLSGGQRQQIREVLSTP